MVNKQFRTRFQHRILGKLSKTIGRYKNHENPFD
ncbi:hypothetical protein CY0110_18347 [Crocosphaera chwakensis CCY0110]|uniref:Uncharacterized protein n=1 Tax=Crocosphaera chwakensis CCY0110 TaxID=391612 RepID=A3IJ01_9CHRO|nr:hypothetical protein CY0110_18347 [Crocosphaera chwakensis CCY0110]